MGCCAIAWKLFVMLCLRQHPIWNSLPASAFLPFFKFSQWNVAQHPIKNISTLFRLEPVFWNADDCGVVNVHLRLKMGQVQMFSRSCWHIPDRALVFSVYNDNPESQSPQSENNSEDQSEINLSHESPLRRVLSEDVQIEFKNDIIFNRHCNESTFVTSKKTLKKHWACVMI